MKNWKTTLIGALSAAGIVVLKLVAAGTMDGQTLVTAGGIALLGFMSKDWNVTGGKIEQ